MWKRYYKQGNERDYDKEIFFKFINLSVCAEISKSRKYGNQPTYSCIVNSICGAILKITKFFKNGKLCNALSKQSITEELLKSGFSPTVQSTTMLYEAIENF